MTLPKKHAGGRPTGRVTFNAESALAFGTATRTRRKLLGMSQELLAHLSDIDRGHMGCIERGENQPSLWLILKISRSLQCSAADLMAATEARIAP